MHQCFDRQRGGGVAPDSGRHGDETVDDDGRGGRDGEHPGRGGGAHPAEGGPPRTVPLPGLHVQVDQPRSLQDALHDPPAAQVAVHLLHAQVPPPVRVTSLLSFSYNLFCSRACRLGARCTE